MAGRLIYSDPHGFSVSAPACPAPQRGCEAGGGLKDRPALSVMRGLRTPGRAGFVKDFSVTRVG